MTADPYKILGIQRSATEKEVKAAYRKLAKQYHPDRNQDNPKAGERFNEITRAYDILEDTGKRARFDRGEIDIDGNPAGFGGGGYGSGRGGGGFRPDDFAGGGFGGAENIDLGNIFEGLFGGGGQRGGGPQGGGQQGGGQRRAPKGANSNYRLAVALPDAAICASQRITLSDGKTIDVKLPAGVEEGTQMRLAGKGDVGMGGNGDAIVTIAIQPHAFYRKEGDMIRLDLPIALDEAVHGAKIKVPTVDGAVMLAVAAGSSSGKTLRLKGRGFTRKDGSRGDQLVTLEIMLPEGDADLAARLDGWRDTRDLRGKLGV
ncbi:MAG: hypothetical protein RLY97_2146 [Pseudomonadota bacterium]|jgi:DnaJ-class molecular chaperone